MLFRHLFLWFIWEPNSLLTIFLGYQLYYIWIHLSFRTKCDISTPNNGFRVVRKLHAQKKLGTFSKFHYFMVIKGYFSSNAHREFFKIVKLFLYFEKFLWTFAYNFKMFFFGIFYAYSSTISFTYVSSVDIKVSSRGEFYLAIS